MPDMKPTIVPDMNLSGDAAMWQERERIALAWISERGYDKHGVAEFIRALADEGVK